MGAQRGGFNLRIETDAPATRLVFEGRRCVGARFRRGGVEHEVRAARESYEHARRAQRDYLDAHDD